MRWNNELQDEVSHVKRDKMFHVYSAFRNGNRFVHDLVLVFLGTTLIFILPFGQVVLLGDKVWCGYENERRTDEGAGTTKNNGVRTWSRMIRPLLVCARTLLGNRVELRFKGTTVADPK